MTMIHILTFYSNWKTSESFFFRKKKGIFFYCVFPLYTHFEADDLGCLGLLIVSWDRLNLWHQRFSSLPKRLGWSVQSIRVVWRLSLQFCSPRRGLSFPIPWFSVQPSDLLWVSGLLVVRIKQKLEKACTQLSLHLWISATERRACLDKPVGLRSRMRDTQSKGYSQPNSTEISQPLADAKAQAK